EFLQHAIRLVPEAEIQQMQPVLDRFGADLEPVRARLRQQNMDAVARDLGQRRTDPDEAQPLLGDWPQTLGVGDYLAVRADQGVPLHLVVWEPELHGGAAYAYWVIEVVLAGLLVGLFLNKLAAENLCYQCVAKRVRTPLGTVKLPADQAIRALREGEL